MAFDLDVELHAGHGCDLRGDDRLDAQVRQRSPKDSTAEHDVLWRQLEVLRRIRDLPEEAEWVVLQHVDALVIGSEIVDLLFEHARPEVRAQELHRVQLVFESRHLASQSLD